MDIKVLIVEDHKIMREGLKSLLMSKGQIEVVGEADNGRDALRMIKSLTPNVVLMDIVMPGLNGIEATRTITGECPDTKVIALSSHCLKEYVTGMFSAGAQGYLLKDCAFDELVDAIKTVSQNHTYLSSEITDIFVNEYMKSLSNISCDKSFENLSEREKEVLKLLTEGNTIREIALKLKLSTKTIETYRNKLMQKLNVSSISELTKYAIRAGVIELGN